MTPTRVLIADDSHLFGDALELILDADDRIEVVGRALDGAQAVTLARELDPDVVLVDISMPGVGGFEAIAAMLATTPRGGDRADGPDDPADRSKARAGAIGYLTKGGSPTSWFGRARGCSLSYPFPAMLAFFSVIHVLLSAALVTLILMHSGRDAGFGGMGFTPSSQGGTHIVERNLTRLTVLVSVLFFTNTIILYRLLA